MLRHVFICAVAFLCFGDAFVEHEPRELTTRQTTALAARSDLNQFKRDLKNILKVRVPGTPGHAQVRRFIVDTMEDLGWSIDASPFEAKVPPPFGKNGKMVFTNIIATLDPRAKKRLILACHYDSKHMVDPRNKRNKFLGAIDSAVPCAMLINIARAMERELRDYRNPDLTLQFIFFDGEEAFVEWSSTDSIYGAKHLAKKWKKETWNPDGTTPHLTQLDRIDLFVLLDLLGTAGVSIPSYFGNTGKWHESLSDIETRLFNSNLLTRHRSRIFGGYPYGSIEDDHTPFLRRGVKVLHVIPSPFPHVWHEFSDNENALDYDTIENLNKIFRHFVAEYLHL